MTESEAINEFKERYNIPDYKEHIPEYYEAMDMAIKALEKQIPKKPKTDNRYIMYICPYCNDFVKVSHNYCQNCGQKLDWSDNNDK